MATLRYLVSQPSTSTRALALNYRNSLFTTASNLDTTTVSLTALSDNISTTFRDGPVYSVGLDIVRGLDTGAGSERITISQVAKTRKNPVFIDNFIGIRVGTDQIFQAGVDSSGTTRLADSDSISVTTLGTGSTGIDVGYNAKLLTGLGDDGLVVTAAKAVLGATAAPIVDYAGLGSVAIKNAGRIDLGAGNDKVVADGSWRGVFNLDGKTVDFGAGSDNLAGYGEDSRAGETSAGIFNGTGSVIRMGWGDVTPPAPGAPATTNPGNQSDKDIVTGIGTGHGAYIVEEYDPTQPGIFNNGTIYMGGGADVIDAISGGFAGAGTYDLGGDTSADTVAGFGAGTFKGGGGLDQLILPEGRYTASYSPALTNFALNRSVNVTITKDGAEAVMSLEGFEQVAGVADLAPTPFANGSRAITTFQVTADGNLQVI